MLEAILSLRGVELSSTPKEMLESPPGGRSTLELLLDPGSIPLKVVVVVIYTVVVSVTNQSVGELN